MARAADSPSLISLTVTHGLSVWQPVPYHQSHPGRYPADMATSAERALSLLHAAVAQAESAVRDEADPRAAFRLATELAAVFHRGAGEVSRLRGVAALRIKEQDKLSLRGLADVIGVSYPRARELAAVGESEASHE
jgi:hypothetical protein